jgi:multicomponent Na+:H+ antiporter subunit B
LKWIGYILIVLMVVLLGYTVADIASFGDPDSPPSAHVSPDYIKNSYHDTHTPNFVSSILADYRGYDTFGETTVIFTAGLVCLLLLGGWKPDDR